MTRHSTSLARVAWVASCVSVCATTSACFLDDSVPPGAEILCRNDAECPSGEACNVEVHVCAKPGDVARGPKATSAVFTPASVGDGATVTLTIDADIATNDTATIAFADAGTPKFVVDDAASTPTTVVLRAGIGEHVAEGFYVLESVDLVDAKGAHIHRTFVDQAAFKVDRTPPTIENVAVHTSDGGDVVSDLTGSNNVIVTFLVDEPIDASGLKARVGQQPLDCTVGAALSVRCTGVITGANVVDGDNAVVVDATDAAGNTAEATSHLVVDLSPPRVVDGSVQVVIDGNPNATFATVGSSIDLAFLFDEPLAENQPPIVTLSSGDAFVEVQAAGSFYRLHAVVTAGEVANGLLTVTASSSDRFGHVGTSEVPLPPPYALGIPFEPTPVSPCVVPPDPSGSSCTDFDGDGFFGPSAHCAPNPVDCDDRDPLVHPGALEIPGDGVRNDCDATKADAPLDGLHVDANNGSDASGNGSATSPLRTLSFALEIAAQQGNVAPVLLAPGAYSLDASSTLVGVPALIGGLDPVTWQRGAGDTTITFTGSVNCFTPLAFDGPALVDGVHIAQGLDLNGGGVVKDTRIDGCDFTIGEAAIVLRVQTSAQLVTFAPSITVIDSQLIDGFEAKTAGTTLLRTHSFSTVTVDGALDVVDSAVDARPDSPSLACTGCTAVRVYYSNIFGDAGSGVLDVTGPQIANVTFIASQLRANATSTMLTLNNAELTAIGNVLDQSGGLLASSPGGTLTADDEDVALLNACTGISNCVAASGNIRGSISTQADELHAGASPAGTNQGDDILRQGSPTSIAGDVDGQCRFLDGHDDVGPDEL